MLSIKNFVGVAFCLLLFVIQVILTIFLTFFVSFWIFLVCLPILATYVVVVVYFYLAPKGLSFTFVPEGTAVLVLDAGGKFIKGLMNWEGKMFDVTGRGINKWKVVDQRGLKKSQGFLGVHFYGLWPFFRIDTYNLRWNDLQLKDNGKVEPTPHTKEVWIVLLRPNTYLMILRKINTLEGISVSIYILVTLRVSNPYRARFVAPPNYIESSLERLESSFRGLIGSLTYEDLLLLEGTKGGDGIWDRLNTIGSSFKETRDDLLRDEWGVEVIKNGINITNIQFDNPEYEETQTEEWRAQRNKARVAQETMGTVVALLAESRGQPIADIQAEINASPVLQDKLMEVAIQLAGRKLSIDSGQFREFLVSGSGGIEGGIEKTLLNLIGAATSLFGGGSGGGGTLSSGDSSRSPKPEASRSSKKKPLSDMTEDEKQREYEEIMKGGEN